MEYSGTTTGTTYTVNSLHGLIMGVQDFVEDYFCYRYDDYYDYGLYSNQGIDEDDSYYFLGPGPLVYRGIEAISLGHTHTEMAIPSVKFISVSQDYGSAKFTESFGNFQATLNLPSDSPPCQGTAFTMTVQLSKGSDVTLYPNTDPRNFITTADDSQYRVNGGGLRDGDTSTPYFDPRLQRLTPGNPNRAITFGVAGYNPYKPVSAGASLTINCQ